MAKRKPSEQSARFRAEVERMIDAGELDPTEADAAFERVVAVAAHKKVDESTASK